MKQAALWVPRLSDKVIEYLPHPDTVSHDEKINKHIKPVQLWGGYNLIFMYLYDLTV